MGTKNVLLAILLLIISVSCGQSKATRNLADELVSESQSMFTNMNGKDTSRTYMSTFGDTVGITVFRSDGLENVNIIGFIEAGLGVYFERYKSDDLSIIHESKDGLGRLSILNTDSLGVIYLYNRSQTIMFRSIGRRSTIENIVDLNLEHVHLDTLTTVKK